MTSGPNPDELTHTSSTSTSSISLDDSSVRNLPEEELNTSRYTTLKRTLLLYISVLALLCCSHLSDEDNFIGSSGEDTFTGSSGEDTFTSTDADTSNDMGSDSVDDTTLDSASDCSSAVDNVITILSNAGWDFTSLKDNATVFSSDHTPKIAHSKKGPPPSWELNYPAIVSLMNGQYYVEYQGVFGMTEKQVMSETAWNKMVPWVGKYVEELALATCEQVRCKVTERGDKFSWIVSFDGFYLTRGHHSNNCSATLHDVSTDKIAWFTHRTKRGPGTNWQGTSGGAEGDMLREILEGAKGKGFNIQQIVMDHDTSGGNVAVDSFPEVRISYCGNHSAKSFHNDLTKLKAIKCKVLYGGHFQGGIYVKSVAIDVCEVLAF